MNKTLKKYIFETGHGKGLAKEEIISLGGAIADEVENGFVVEMEVENPRRLQNRMGGIVRILEIKQEGPATMPINFVEWVSKTILSEVSIGGKIRYALSMHPKADKVLKKILKNSKDILKEKVGNIRFVNKDFQNVSSAAAWHENLLAPGAIELHLFKSESKWYLAKTLSIQDFESYAHRDMHRPNRDIKNGMFPPKLAQILINLAVGKNKALIYDPFCGSGTVLQEALLMGLNTAGSDNDAKMISDTEKNLEWLIKEFDLQVPVPQVFLKDATKLTKEDFPQNCVITSETWLGPLLEKAPSQEEINKIQLEVETLYENFFSNLKKIAPAGTVMVFTAPFHKVGNERHFLPNLQKILERHSKILPLSDHSRPSLFYERKEQLVGREIWKIQI